MRARARALLLLILAATCLPTLCHAATAVEAWVRRYDNGTDSYDYARKVVADNAGNLIVAGGTDDGITGADMLVIKYSASGVPLWTNRFNGPGNSSDTTRAMAVDGSGNIFVTGESVGSGSSYDYATIAYSGTGTPLWTNHYNGPGNSSDIARAVAVDSGGNVFVTGESHGGGSSYDYATIAYSGAGVPLWTNRYSGPGSSSDYAHAVAVDSSGNVFVTGESYVSGSSYDYATIAYSGAGIPMWTNRYNGPANTHDYAQALAVDGSDNVFVTGYSYDTNGYPDYATIAYSGAGMPLWTNRYNGPGNGNDNAHAVAADSNGNVFVTGESAGSGTSYDYATVAYSGSGVPLWTNRYNGPGNRSDYAHAVAVDTNGNVFVTGVSSGSDSSSDYATTIAYSGAGVPLWTNRYDGPANSYDTAAAVAVDSGGNVFVTGSTKNSTGEKSADDYTTIAYSGSGVPLWTNHYNGPSDGYDTAQAVAVDGNGNVFVTGYSSGSGSSYDYATIAYSGTGVTLWIKRYNGPANGNDYARAVAVDGSGKVFVTGESVGISGYPDYATIGYSGAGVPLWTNRYNGPANGKDYALAVAVDSSGSVIVTGYSYGGGSSDDYATVAYSATGLPLWTNRYNGPGNSSDIARAVTVNGSGNVFVTGESVGSGSSYDYATIAYSGTGTPLWTNRYNGPGNGNDYARAVAADGSGIVIVTGESVGSGSTNDYTTIAYSAAGLPLWTNRYNGPANGPDGPQSRSALALGPDGAVYVTGASDANYSSAETPDYATVKYVVLYDPEINLVGNGVGIADGDITPSLADHTDFGSAVVGGSPVARTFTVENVATDPLYLPGVPRVAVSGPQAADFTVTQQPASPLPGGGSTTFQVSFSPGAAGLRTATLSITNNDADENPYDFAIQGLGIPSPPTFTSAALVGGDLVFGGAGGSEGDPYYVLTSTNVTTPMSNWICVATNTFDLGGLFSVTNPATGARQFFRILVP